MTTSDEDLQEAYDLPEGFDIQSADEFERIHAQDGTELCVLVSNLTGERTLVHADVVDYQGVLEHPVTGGVVGFIGILTALLAPIFTGVQAAGAVTEPLLQVAVALTGVAVAYGLSNLVLYRTRVGDWVFRFLEWNDHKALLVGRDSA